jgi:hypothetical protein
MTTDPHLLRLESIARQCADEIRAGRRSKPVRLPVSDVITVRKLVERLLAGEVELWADPH